MLQKKLVSVVGVEPYNHLKNNFKIIITNYELLIVNS